MIYLFIIKPIYLLSNKTWIHFEVPFAFQSVFQQDNPSYLVESIVNLLNYFLNF